MGGGGGTGGGGRAVGMGVGQLGVGEVWLVDPDTVEGHNVGSQGWSQEDVGRKKVDVLGEEIAERWGPLVGTIPERWSWKIAREMRDKGR